jgi:hypothetical protein
MLKYFKMMVDKSVLNPWGGVSSARFSSYFILILIIIGTLILFGIELYSAYIALSTTGKYEISNNIILLMTAILSQQLALLGINKALETKQLKNEVVKTDNTTVIPTPVVVPVKNDVKADVKTDTNTTSDGPDFDTSKC